MNPSFGLALDFWSPTTPLARQLDDYVDLLRLAEGLGFHSVWAGEGHLQTPAPNHVPTPLLLLSALVRCTRLKLGTGVILLPLCHPLRLAHETALLDHLSEGRLILGVGAGHPELMKRYGIQPAERGSRMDEVLGALKSFWAGADEHHGRHYDLGGHVYPAPLQPGGPPIWVGGNIDRSIERAVTLGDGWYGATEYHFDVIKRRARQYRSMLETRPPTSSAGTVCINRLTFIAESDREARDQCREFLYPVLQFYAGIDHLKDGNGVALDPRHDYDRLADGEFCLIGSPETCVEQIKKYRDEAGVSHINFRVRFSDLPIDLATRTVRLLGERVIGALAGA